MIIATIEEAQNHLEKLVAAAENGEDVFISHDDQGLVKLVVEQPCRFRRNLEPRADLKPTLAPGYDPAEPLTEEEWPSDCR